MKDDFLNRYRCNTKSKIIDDNPQSCVIEKIDFSAEVIPALLGGINTYHNDIYHSDIGTV